MGKINKKPKTTQKKPTAKRVKPAKKSNSKSTVIVKKEKASPIELTSMVDMPIFPAQSVKAIINYIAKGHPETEFKPEYVEQILTLMAQGIGIETVCMYLGISFDVMRKWRKNNKNINLLIKYGIQLEKQWWIEQGRRNIYNKEFNHVLWMMNMSNRFDWATNKGKIEGKVAHAHLHQHNGKIEIEEKIKEANNEDRISTVLTILSRSGAFVRKEPVQRIAGKTDTENN
jgi:hypothetical protein